MNDTNSSLSSEPFAPILIKTMTFMTFCCIQYGKTIRKHISISIWSPFIEPIITMGPRWKDKTFISQFLVIVNFSITHRKSTPVGMFMIKLICSNSNIPTYTPLDLKGCFISLFITLYQPINTSIVFYRSKKCNPHHPFFQ